MAAKIARMFQRRARSLPGSRSPVQSGRGSRPQRPRRAHSADGVSNGRAAGIVGRGGRDGVHDGEYGGRRGPSPHHAPRPARRRAPSPHHAPRPTRRRVWSRAHRSSHAPPPIIENLAPVPSHRWGLDLRRRRSIAWWPEPGTSFFYTVMIAFGLNRGWLRTEEGAGVQA
jgi:hypothetical protein